MPGFLYHGTELPARAVVRRTGTGIRRHKKYRCPVRKGRGGGCRQFRGFCRFAGNIPAAIKHAGKMPVCCRFYAAPESEARSRPGAALGGMRPKKEKRKTGGQNTAAGTDTGQYGVSTPIRECIPAEMRGGLLHFCNGTWQASFQTAEFPVYLLYAGHCFKRHQ